VRKPVANDGRLASPTDLGVTEQQLRVLALMMQGMSNKAICRSLGLAETTVKYHVTAILKALQVTNRTEAVLAVVALGWELPSAHERKARNSGDTSEDVEGQTPDGATAMRAPNHKDGAGSRSPTARHLDLPDEPSIAVLPFTNLSGDPSQDYFADGVVEDLTVALGRIHWLFVIGSGSASTYKGRSIDVRQVGLELGVRYVLRGSIRKLDNRVRITVQLLDTAGGGQIWAERFDSELTNIFETQDRVAAQVGGIVAPMMRHVEIERAKRKPTDNLTAYDLFLQALPLCRLNNINHDEALRLLFRAIDLDPTYAAPYGLAALCFRAQLSNSRQMPDDPRVGEGIRLAHLAAEMGDNDPEALWMAGETMFILAGEFDRAKSLVDKSILLNPNSASAWNALGIIRVNVGDAETALTHFTFARRLNPLRSFHHDFRVGVSVAHFFAERFEESVENAEAVLNDRPNYPRALMLKAASCGLLGLIGEGRKSVQALLAINPQFTMALFKAIHEAPMRLNPRGLDNYCKGLRASGLPEG